MEGIVKDRGGSSRPRWRAGTPAGRPWPCQSAPVSPARLTSQVWDPATALAREAREHRAVLAPACISQDPAHIREFAGERFVDALQGRKPQQRQRPESSSEGQRHGSLEQTSPGRQVVFNEEAAGSHERILRQGSRMFGGGERG